MKRVLLALLTLTIGAVAGYPAAGVSPHDVDAALAELDHALEHRGEYIDRRQAHIDSLCTALRNSSSTDPDLILEIAKGYTAFNNDSALHYLQEGAAVTDFPRSLDFTLRMAALMPLDGDLQQALDLYRSIDEDSVPQNLKSLYYESGRQMYSYIEGLHTLTPEQKKAFGDLALQRQQCLVEVADKNSDDYNYHLGEYYFVNNETERAKTLLKKVMETSPSNSNLRARAAHHLSSIARYEDDFNTYLYYLSQAAMADVTAATREVAALQELGGYLYKRNDVDRAYSYLSIALASAVECGAPLRVLESSQMLPIIERANTEQLNQRERTIRLILWLLAIMLVGMIVAVTLLVIKMRGLRRLQRSLRVANRTREDYIAQFLNLCTVYMDKLNQLCKLTERKISSGKVDELLRLAKSGRFVEDQSKEFYEIFDSAFLHLYPDFPREVNKLLKPDKQIELKNPEVLNTELRILAVMRMGINDSSRIAQVLNFSINTIYSYRNRIRAKAIDRDNFETDICSICEHQA